MSLWICLIDPHTDAPLHNEAGLFLEDDGCYWFMHPHFIALREKTGVYVDLYGGDTFTAEHFDDLSAAIDAITQDALKSPDIIPAVTGVSGGAEVIEWIQRDRLLDLVGAWRAVIGRARETGWRIQCIGD